MAFHDGLNNDRAMVFEYLAGCRSMVQLSTGWIDSNNIVRHNYVVVRNAPPRVVKEVVGMFTMVSLNSDGLLIPLVD